LRPKALLAFDTSAAHCAAALLCDGVVSVKSESMDKGQAERLMPLLEEVLAEAGLDWHDLAAVAVGTGPGNFTGVRIAVAAARGLKRAPWLHPPGSHESILAMDARVTSSMIARLSAWLHVCLFARWHTRPDGHQAACQFACLPVCMPGYLPAFILRQIGKAHAWRAITSRSKRSNAAPGDPPRRRRPIGRPLSSSATGKGACTTTPPSAG
jgi:hypothetical protein